MKTSSNPKISGFSVFTFLATSTAKKILKSRFSVALIINLLFVTAISLGTASVLNYYATRKSLIQQININLGNESRELALLVGEVVLEHIELLETLSIDGIIQNDLEKLDQAYLETYTGQPEEIVKDLEARNALWLNAPDEHPFVQSILNSDISEELEKFLALFPDYDDLLVTDQHGALVGSTQHADDYYQADEDWWQAAWNDGKGAIYVSQPIFYDDLNAYVSEIAVPVYKDKVVVGIIHSVYRLDSVLLKVLDSVEFETGGSRLYPSETDYLDSHQISGNAPLPPNIVSRTEGAQQQPIDYDGRPSFVSLEPVRTITETGGVEGYLTDSAIKNLNWHILVYQSAQEALQPLTVASKVTLITSAGALTLAIVVGSILAKIVSNPIQVLIETAQKMQADTITSQDLQKLDIIAEKGDDMGELAVVFRDMSRVILEREQSLANEISSLQAKVEAETQQATDIELSYYKALKKKSVWIRRRNG